jgi:hypothetical protein
VAQVLLWRHSKTEKGQSSSDSLVINTTCQTSLTSFSTNLSPYICAFRNEGFAGYELGADHTLDIYTISTNTWRTVLPSPDSTHGYPGARSVHGFVPFQSKSNPAAIALLYHGERDASSLGHAGAGTFWDDLWLLEYHKSKDGNLSWKKVDIAEDSKKPEARGWIPSASYVDEHGETKVVMFGGLLSSNERSDELWLLEIE